MTCHRHTVKCAGPQRPGLMTLAGAHCCVCDPHPVTPERFRHARERPCASFPPVPTLPTPLQRQPVFGFLLRRFVFPALERPVNGTVRCGIVGPGFRSARGCWDWSCCDERQRPLCVAAWCPSYRRTRTCVFVRLVISVWLVSRLRLLGLNVRVQVFLWVFVFAFLG